MHPREDPSPPSSSFPLLDETNCEKYCDFLLELVCLFLSGGVLPE